MGSKTIGRLLVPPSQFPYGLASFALYTGRAELCIDSTSDRAVLEIDDGRRITSEDEIMWALAGSAIAGTSNEVSQLCLIYIPASRKLY